MKYKKWIILIICFVFIIIIGFLIFEEFTIKNIVIIGNKHISEKEIRAIIGIKEGYSIIYPTSKTFYERLKKAPWIKDAAIRKDLNGTLTIYIKESTPVAIAIFNGRTYLIDCEAQVLEDFTDKLNSSAIFLPVIKDIDPFKNKQTLHEAIKLVNFINSKGFVKSENKITITGNNSDNLTMDVDGFSVIVGKGDLETKFAKYLVVISEIQKKGLQVQYIDLRFPDRVIVKPLE